MREYGQIQLRFWINPEIQELSNEGKLLATYLLTGPHSNSLGCFRCPDGYVSEDLRWKPETVTKAFDELSEVGFIERDAVTGWTLLPKYLKWNSIQNAKVGVSVARLVERIPPDATIYGALIEALKKYGNRLPEELINHINTVCHTVSDTVSKRYSIPYRYNEPEPEPDNKCFSNEKQGACPDSTESKHFSNQIGNQYRDQLLEVLNCFRNGKSKKINVFAFVQKKVNEGNAHPEALLRILNQLLAQWNKVKNPWGWLERRFEVENQNFQESKFQVAVEKFKQTWGSFAESDEAKEIMSHLNLARAP